MPLEWLEVIAHPCFEVASEVAVKFAVYDSGIIGVWTAAIVNRISISWNLPRVDECIVILLNIYVCVCVACTISNSVPDTWAKFSDTNIRRSQSERQASRDLRNNIEQLCNTVTMSLMNEWNAANTALSERVKEYTEARNQLQTHLSKVS